MIKDDVFSMEFLKKSAFSGSFQGMRYRLYKEEKQLIAVVFPGPYAYDYTSDEVKTAKSFTFDDAGYTQALDWLQEMYYARDWSDAEDADNS